MRPKTNRLLMLLLGAAISGCASQTDRSSSGGGQTQIEHERVGGSTNAVTKEELERRAAAQAAAETAASQPAPVTQPAPAYEPQRESVQYVDRPLEDTPPRKAATVAAAPENEPTPDFPITTYVLPEDQATDDDIEDLGAQDDESVSAEQDAMPAGESSVGETALYADLDADSDEVEDLGMLEDESVSAEQDAASAGESSVGETALYADEQDAEIEDLGTQPDASGSVTYPEEKRAAAENLVGAPKVYQDEPAPQTAPVAPQKPKPAAPKTFSVNFETEPLFSFDRSEIRADQRAKLDEFISGLGGAQYDSIAVVGYADRIGTKDYNQKLSERRAEAVRAYLVRKGVPANKIQTEGRGETDPVTGDTCNKTRGKALISCLQPDRRVDVSVSATKKAN